MGAIMKWYIELPRSTFHDFNSLSMAFLTHFQLSVRYEARTYLLTSLKQDTATHIFDHINEWRRRHRLIKFKIIDQLFTERFTKSFVAPIACDIAMGGCATEEKAIAHAQYLELVYSQSITLYELLPNAPRPSSNPTASKQPIVPPIDGVIGSVSQTPTKTSSKQKPISNAPPNNSSRNPPSPGKTLEVHTDQSTAVDKSSKGKKKGKVKAKVDAPKQGPPKFSAGESSQQKPKHPCPIYKEDHYTKDCPRRFEVSHLLKGIPVVLKDPFLS